MGWHFDGSFVHQRLAVRLGVMKRLRFILPVLAGATGVACGSIASLDGRPCPCATGYVCHDGTCVTDPTPTTFGVDSGGAPSGGPANGGPTSHDAGSGADSFVDPNDCNTACVVAAQGGCGASTGSECVALCASSPTKSQLECLKASSCSTLLSALEGRGTICGIAAPTEDAGYADEGGEGSSDAETGESAYCYYASDAGGYDCSYENDTPNSTHFECGCTGTQGSAATAAQTTLDCMSGGGSIVTVCPSKGLVGCCTSSYGDFAGLPPYPDGSTVACSYGADMQDELHCVAYGGSWSTTAPR